MEFQNVSFKDNKLKFQAHYYRDTVASRPLNAAVHSIV